MFTYVKFKIVKKADNPRWLFRNFIGRELDGRISLLSDGELNNHQIKHPNYSNWFDIPKDLIEVQE